MRVVASAVPGTARPLPPLRPLTIIISATVTPVRSPPSPACPAGASGPPGSPAPGDAFSDERPNSIRDNTATCSTSSSTRASARSARCSARSERSRQDVTSVTSTTSGSGPTQRSKHVRAGHISNPATRASRAHPQRLHARTEYLRLLIGSQLAQGRVENERAGDDPEWGPAQLGCHGPVQRGLPRSGRLKDQRRWLAQPGCLKHVDLL
jgi:hypothetical protein